MATSPSKRFEDGVLVERAISSDVAGDPDEAEDFTQRPAKAPGTTTMADRLKARTSSGRGRKAVDDSTAENKSVKAAEKK